MTGYVLSPAARSDLENIWNYTARTWGDGQAEIYVLSIRAALDGLAEGKLLARSAEDIRPGYRKYAVGSHFLFFRLTDAGVIDVIRILHQRMDVPSRLHD